MRLIITADHVEFVAAGSVAAGRHSFADPFKPHVHPLASPKGQFVSLALLPNHEHPIIVDQ